MASVAFALVFVWVCGEVDVLGWKHLMLCPVSDLGTRITRCDTARVADGLFVRKSLGAHPGLLGSAARLLLSQGAAAAVKVSDAQLHACVMGLFASFIAPFGGFLASGFKRAFKIKDFSSVIPGHGGFTDRFDCQLLMGLFSYVYCHHFIGLGQEEGSGAVGHFFNAVRQTLGKDDIQALVERLQALLREG